MKRLSLQPHPFRLLLVLEWILLGLSAFKLFGFPGWSRPILWDDTGLFSSISLKSTDALWLLGLVLVFGALGLRLPTARWAKWLYVAISFGLIGTIATLQNWALDSLSPLLLVMLLRSCLLFGRAGRWTVAGLMWLVYPVTLAPVLLILWGVLRFASIQDWSIPPNSGFALTPDGGLRVNMSFSPEQVQQFLVFTRKFILHFLLDNLLSFGLVLIFVLLLVNSLVNERQGRRKLAIAHEQLYQYSLQIDDQATLKERTRIAREIHDSLGHLLTAQNIQLQNATLSFTSNQTEAKTFLDDGRQLGTKAMAELRQAITLLRSNPLQEQSFEQAILDVIAHFQGRTGIKSICHINVPTTLPMRVQVAVYRILTEALTNIHKHSSATEVNIELDIKSAPTNPSLYLQIEDNGCGFNLEQNSMGFGLRGMKERVADLDAQLQILTQPEHGCRIVVSFPLLRGMA